MYCNNCKNSIKDNAKFCPICGTPQTIKKNDSEYAERNSSCDFDFHKWIIENELESYEDFLIKQDLNSIDVLMSLSESDLLQIGIESIGMRKKILNGVQKLKTTAQTFNATKVAGEQSSIPNRCPNCGDFWAMQKETSGAGNTLGKALIGGLLLGPIGAIGGAAFGNKSVTFICEKCGFKKEYKTSVLKSTTQGIKEIFK